MTLDSAGTPEVACYSLPVAATTPTTLPTLTCYDNFYRSHRIIMSSGSTCAVVGCTNNSRKLKDFMNGACFQHNLQTRKTCLCPVPYALHSIPKDEAKTREWLAALKLKQPPKRVYVCSFHFFDHKPTELHPNPELFLGYERPPVKKRRRLTRCEVTAQTSQTSALTSDDVVQREEPRK